MHTPIRYGTTLALALLVALVVIVPQSRGRASDTRAGCGILVDAAHPWHSRTQDAPVETGDHWIIERGGRLSSCAFTRGAVHRLLAAPADTYEHGDSDALLGGSCTWGTGSRTERIRPFQHIACLLPFHLRHHRFLVLVQAFVDPDPRFIAH